jgi:pimeloyl-ACP methyl ester carboxylesterase
MPALIVQGRNDVQVDVADAERLKAAKPDAQLALIDGMNHMLRISPGTCASSATATSIPNCRWRASWASGS